MNTTTASDEPSDRSRVWLAPVATVALYVAVIGLMGDFRPEHGLVAGLTIGLGLLGGKPRKFLLDMTPYLILAIGYDMVRYVRDAVVRPEHVLGCGLRDAELALFAVAPGVTPQDWFATHHVPPADLAAAVPYAGFIYIAFGYAGYLFFRDRTRMRHFLWALTVAHYVAFVMWILTPAAPPWYLRAHGCVIDLAAAPDPGGLVRVDHMLGISYFRSFYSRSSSVFGALPSMHCAFPLLGLLTAWKSTTWKTRWMHVVYVVWMATAAVYLDHHWIIDVMAGWLVAMVAVVLVGWVMRRRAGVAATRADREIDVGTS
ncbi:MAG: phosphatase PAP2 family protein [Polyangiaceae bacterium]|jgi:membrane-associated phospholipid phosphatase|nr:phosphatase PAP2 family protein [Polyangiaceae bacterium]